MRSIQGWSITAISSVGPGILRASVTLSEDCADSADLAIIVIGERSKSSRLLVSCTLPLDDKEFLFSFAMSSRLDSYTSLLYICLRMATLNPCLQASASLAAIESAASLIGAATASTDPFTPESAALLVATGL